MKNEKNKMKDEKGMNKSKYTPKRRSLTWCAPPSVCCISYGRSILSAQGVQTDRSNGRRRPRTWWKRRSN